MEDQQFPSEINLNIEIDPQEGFYAIYAGLRMFKDSEGKRTSEHNKTVPENEQIFSIPGAQAYCLLQDILEENPVYYAWAENRFNSDLY